jgi:predicted nucleic acid-binding protein
MSIVVSDTSPIRALRHLDLLHVLGALYGNVYVPEAVARELAVPRLALPAVDVAAIPFLVVQAPRDVSRITAAEPLLDEGEADAIALALEHRATLILVDERLGREVARKLGLTPIGVLGILSSAKARSLIPELRPLLERLRTEIKFFLSQALIDQVLRDAGE